MSDHPTPEKILQTGLAFWASKTLLSAIEMGFSSTRVQALVGPDSMVIGIK